MQLGFENWLSQQTLPIDARDVFKEAIVCYKASAYRAALLFSYLGFMSVVRQRILEAGAPAGYQTGEWNSLRRTLRDDDKWEKETFEAIQRKPNQPTDKSIFVMSEDIREQVSYFKNRRNDCAHSRRNEITFAHVETLWAFVESNLAKFVVRGSSASLIEQIRRHYDPAITPPNTTPTSLIEQIPQAVELHSRLEFFAQVKETLRHISSSNPFANDVEDFFCAIFDLGNEDLSADLVDYLIQDESLLRGVLQQNLSSVIYLRGHDDIIRKLWYEGIPQRFFSYELLAILLSEKLIPDAQREQAMEHVILKSSSIALDDDVYDLLREQGFIDIYHRIAFATPGKVTDFDWSRDHAQIVVQVIDREGWDVEKASAMTRALSGPYYSYQLCLSVQAYFQKAPHRRNEFLAIIEENDLGDPDQLLDECPPPY